MACLAAEEFTKRAARPNRLKARVETEETPPRPFSSSLQRHELCRSKCSCTPVVAGKLPLARSVEVPTRTGLISHALPNPCIRSSYHTAWLRPHLPFQKGCQGHFEQDYPPTKLARRPCLHDHAKQPWSSKRTTSKATLKHSLSINWRARIKYQKDCTISRHSSVLLFHRTSCLSEREQIKINAAFS